MENNTSQLELFEVLREKALLKKEVYRQTLSAFELLRSSIMDIVAAYQDKYNSSKPVIPFEFRDRGEFELELRFGGDVLIFLMHSNIFEFSRTHEVMKTTYIREEKSRSYCGMISIYNFLADSFKYNRMNDIGYMIGRVFINKDAHYFIEGKRELGRLYNNFATSVITNDTVSQIIESAVLYTINFDLLTPPYDAVKLVSVSEMQASLDDMKLKTGKRLGFRFQADPAEPITEDELS
jgi:hypothetical protein